MSEKRPNALKLKITILSVVALVGALPMTQAQAHPVDPSLQPIAADEPLPAQGFPPLPDRLDLPTTSAWEAAPAAAPVQAQSAQSKGTTWENYRQIPAGAFIPSSDRHHSYTRSEQFAAGGARPISADPNVGALRRLGPEPKLHDSNDQPQAPSAPQVMTVQQATTQDLSLPEDEFQQKQTPSRNSGSNVARRVNQMVIQRGFGLGQQLINK
jgi:hypothetical protein